MLQTAATQQELGCLVSVFEDFQTGLSEHLKVSQGLCPWLLLEPCSQPELPQAATVKPSSHADDMSHESTERSVHNSVSVCRLVCHEAPERERSQCQHQTKSGPSVMIQAGSTQQEALSERWKMHVLMKQVQCPAVLNGHITKAQQQPHQDTAGVCQPIYMGTS